MLIVDYGVGNVASLVNMFDHLGIVAEATADRDRIATAEKLVLPGVGAFDRAMDELRSRDLVDSLNFAARSGRTQILGVCLGMQLLARSSEEGGAEGLGWIDADVVRLPQEIGRKIPHIGWADVQIPQASHLFPDPSARERFYFVHSFWMKLDDPTEATALFDFGLPVTAAVSRGNIHGVQFHPEKSHRFGMRLLGSFARGDLCVPA